VSILRVALDELPELAQRLTVVPIREALAACQALDLVDTGPPSFPALARLPRRLQGLAGGLLKYFLWNGTPGGLG
jgi:hypothetical protein